MVAIGRIRYAAFTDVPVLPQGYHLDTIRDTPNGVRADLHFKGARIFEIAVELHYSFEYDDPVGTRYAARVVHDNHPKRRAFNNDSKWVEYDSMSNMIHALLARHRIGAQK